MWPRCKNYENLLRFDKVTADYKVVPFFPRYGVFVTSSFVATHLCCKSE